MAIYLKRGASAEAKADAYGEVIVAESYEEMVQIADQIASEHVQVMTEDRKYFLQSMAIRQAQGDQV